MEGLTERSLHVGNFAVYKRDLEVLVDKDLLGAKIDDLVGVPERGFHLIGGLPFFYLLRLGRGRLLLRLSLSRTLSCTLVAALLVVALLIASTLIAGLLRIVSADR